MDWSNFNFKESIEPWILNVCTDLRRSRGLKWFRVNLVDIGGIYKNQKKTGDFN